MRRFLHLLCLWLTVCTVSAETFYGPTQPSEHLWQVASQQQSHYPGTSVKQWMVAFYQANPTAFKQANMNGLMAGYRLRVPLLADVEVISKQTADQTLDRHNQIWTAGATGSTQASLSLTNSAAVQARLADLNHQVAQLSLNFSGAMAHMQGEYAYLASESKQLHSQLVSLSRDLSVAARGMSVKPLVIEPESRWDYFWDHVRSEWFTPDSIRVASVAAFLLVLAMLWVMWAPDSVQYAYEGAEMDEEADSDPDLRDEYDFMGSEEGIPAKLDLARAYIDMEEYESADQVLSEVISGRVSQDYRSQAEMMRQEMAIK